MTTTSTTTPAILIRRINYGDYDLILTLLRQTEGKVSVMAKAAKKSVKRFGGALELFSEVTAVFSSGPGRKLPFLQEAVLVQPFSNIRSNILKTAYASYWSETLHHWMMEGKKEEPIFQLLQFTLKEMDIGGLPDALLSLIFQSKFLSLSGLYPDLRRCMVCREPIERIKAPDLAFNPRRGGLSCQGCSGETGRSPTLSKGTVKLLNWIEKESIDHIRRIRFSPRSLSEARNFLEAVIPYHLGKVPKSLNFLKKIRPGVEE
jgi:DNA repair protein RecO (recombination protein O)